MTIAIELLLATLAGPALAGERKPKPPAPLEAYVNEAAAREASVERSPGSLFSSGARLSDLARDFRAAAIDDTITILVADKASAISRGATNSSRKSSANASITSLAKVYPATSALANLANLGGEQKLQGQGETSRESALTTALSARVVRVLPNGFLVVEGAKEVQVNSERQRVVVRGVARPRDLDALNRIASDRLAQLEIHVEGKGVVNDAVRRPWFLYRLLTGLLPM